MICNSLINPPLSCSEGPKVKEEYSIVSWIILSVIGFILLLVFILFFYRRIVRRQISNNMNKQVNELVNQYITMYEADKFKGSDGQIS